MKLASYQAKFNLDELIAAFGDRLLDVHVHDATRHKDYRTATHLPIGEGSIEFSQLLNMLRKAGYDDWLTLEVKGNNREIVKSKQILEELINAKSQYM